MKKVFVFLLAAFLSGCATVQIPDSKSSLAPLTNAPVVLVQAVDSRGTTKMGTIGMSTFKLKSSDAVQVLGSTMQEILYDDKISGDLLPGSAEMPENQVPQALTGRNAEGLLVLNLVEAKVSSIDLILDQPKYSAIVQATLYDETGKKLFSEKFSGDHSSRTMTLNGQGAAIKEAIKMALMRAKSSTEFQSYKQKI